MTQRTDVPIGITPALLAWQETGDEAWLERVIAATTARLTGVARHVLRRHHIGDWSAVDDALALAFDHLRRLPSAAAHERAVAPFDATRHTRGGDDPGTAYLVWLVRDRALDVVRKRRRRASRECSLGFTDRHAAPCGCDFRADHDADRMARLHAAIGCLEPRLRIVVEMLLAGKSQAVIAHLLDVCEGTVSRLRTRAIAELQRMLN